MRSGLMRRVLDYQTQTETADALGQLVPTWSTVTTVRAEVRAPRGTEATIALQVRAFVGLVIECRYPPSTGPFDPKGRLVDVTDPTATGAIYNIVSSVDPDGRRRRLVTMATELAAAPSTDTSNL